MPALLRAPLRQHRSAHGDDGGRADVNVVQVRGLARRSGVCGLYAVVKVDASRPMCSSDAAMKCSERARGCQSGEIVNHTRIKDD